MGVIEARRRILLNAPHVETTTPAGVSNFTTDLISPLKSLKAGFLPVQSGSGDPSPQNIRSISGWSGVTVYHSGTDTSNPTSIPVTFPASAGTVYGGYVDLVRGEVVAEYADYVFTEDENWQASSTPNRFFVYMTLEKQMAIQTTVSNAEQNVYTDMFGRCVYKNADGVAYFVTNSSIRQIVVNTQAASSVSDIKQLTTGMQMVYELETPIHYPLTPQVIKSLRGTNNIWSDANDDVSVEYWKH